MNEFPPDVNPRHTNITNVFTVYNDTWIYIYTYIYIYYTYMYMYTYTNTNIFYIVSHCYFFIFFKMHTKWQHTQRGIMSLFYIL